MPQGVHGCPLDGMYLPIEKAEMALSILPEGSSVSTVERVTGVHHGTILKLLVQAGEKAGRIMARRQSAAWGIATRSLPSSATAS